MRRLAISMSLLAAALAAMPAWAAQERREATDPNLATVKQLMEGVAAAFDAGDAKKLAAFWAEDAEMVDMHGNQTQGRAAIEKGFAEMLTKRPGGKLKLQVLGVRTVGPAAVIAEVTSEVTPRTPEQPAGAVASMILVKQDGKWLIESARDEVREVPAAAHLKDLEWMVGRWSGAAKAPEKTTVSGSCNWTGTKSHLVRAFAVVRNGVARQGTEVIGWDPRQKTIRSWAFDSAGDYVERIWKQDGKRWQIESKGTLADGSSASATEIITPLGNDAFTVESKDRKRNGQKEPDVPAIEMKRQPEPAGAPEPKSAQPVLPK